MIEPSQTLILVIDDDAAVRRLCVELLQRRGYQTLAADSVGEGLRLFAEKRPAAGGRTGA